jgi:hypothetical protein
VGSTSPGTGGSSSPEFTLHNEIKKMVEVTEQGLRSLMYKAVRLGIKESGVFSQGVDKSCGGKVFVKSIK